MSEKNKAILEKGNAAVAEGNYEEFVELCADDTKWTFVGDKILHGKAAVRQWITTEYVEPPDNKVAHLIAEGDFVTAVGDITVKQKDGTIVHYAYCDVWRFRDAEIVELTAFVIETEDKLSPA